jgi:hypothetical protein
MKSKIQFVTFGLLTVLSITSLFSGARAQTTLDCSTIPGASSYGTDLSVCRMPDQSTLECSQDKGGLSFCQAQHANGFVTRAVPQSPIEGLGMLIGWMIHTHQQHVTDTAVNDASSTVLLTMKHTEHLMDMSALADRLVPYLPPEQKDAWTKLSKNLADQSSAFSGAVSLFSANWMRGADRSSYHSEAKKLQKLYDSGLIAVCTARSASQILTGKLDSVRANLAANVIEALDAVRGDEVLLEPECSSNRAIKLLQSQPKNTVTPK